MKYLLILACVLVALSVLAPLFMNSAIGQTEKQPYRVVLTEGDFEVRFYPSAVLATVRSDATSYREMSGSGFRRVAGYIFGGNARNQKIAMTAPVHMDIGGSGSSMSFVMPAGYDLENLPKPDDPGVVLERSGEEHVAALRFSGWASDAVLSRRSEELYRILREKGLEPVGNLRYLGYDPPYRVSGRRNEVVVAIRWTEAGNPAQ